MTPPSPRVKFADDAEQPMSEQDSEPIHLSPLDHERFHVRTAKAMSISAATLPRVMDYCRSHEVSLLISRCPTTDSTTVHALEARGFRLMGTTVYWVLDLQRQAFKDVDRTGMIRPLRSTEAEEVGGIAAAAFHNFCDHYHADERLDPSKCDALYSDWALRCCVSKDVADQVFVAEVDETIVGFAAVQLRGATESAGVLSAVDPSVRRRGIHVALLRARALWSKQQGARKMFISSPLTNVRAQRNWLRVGYEPSHSKYTFHKWFDKP